jgi:serine protease Do
MTTDMKLARSGIGYKTLRTGSVILLWATLLYVTVCAWAVGAELPDFTDLVQKSSPAVVNISTTQKHDHGMNSPHGQMPEAPLDEFLRRFFGDEYGGGGDEDYDEKSLGSGFVISPDGYILTNAHVIGDADEIVVRLSDRREFVAKVVGMDKRSDVALLKIDADHLPVVTVGRSGDVKAGSWVLAIGSPFGFDHTVTAGIVSATGRSLPNENYVPFIQTDVAINPGNSGGPLFNLKGEVIGINSQIYSRTGGFMGLSFAIPIDMAMNVTEQLKKHGRVTRGWLGILIQDVTRELAESFDMSKPVGALVAKVLPDSPAEKAGFKVGDIIVKFNGHEVESSSALPPMVGSTPVGDEVPVSIMREGKSQKLMVTIRELPEEEELKLASRGDTKDSVVERLAITVSDLTEDQRSELQISGGVFVESVDSGAASKAGIRRGDVLVMIDQQRVEDAAQFKKVVDGLHGGSSVPVLVQRRGSPIFLALKVAED